MPPHRGESYWNATGIATDFPRLCGDVEADIVVVGGGIVGVTAARVLKDCGLKVALVEARKVGRQVTGRSTAKVTSQHGLIYQKLEGKFGRRAAQLYAEAQEAAIRKIQDLASRYHIDCSLQSTAAHTYATDQDAVAKIEKELELALELGLPAALIRGSELPIDCVAALRFEGQAQFHPTNYLAGLAKTLSGDGCSVYENSPVVEWQPTCVHTEHGSVTARHVVIATHLPLG